MKVGIYGYIKKEAQEYVEILLDSLESYNIETVIEINFLRINQG